MAYGGSTPFYQLPYMITDDVLTQSDEERRAKIIDGLLFVATYGATSAVVEDAEYMLTNITSEGCTLTLSSVGTEYVFAVIINSRLAYRKESIRLELAQGSKYWVYVVYTSDLDTDSQASIVTALEEEVSDWNHLLLCTVDFTESEPILDTDTDKRYLQNITAHTLDSTNPHGTELAQSKLRITTALYLQEQRIYPSTYITIESCTGTVPTTVAIAGMKPIFVTATAEDLAVGNIACKINADGTVSVSNSGAVGYPIQLKIEGEL